MFFALYGEDNFFFKKKGSSDFWIPDLASARDKGAFALYKGKLEKCVCEARETAAKATTSPCGSKNRCLKVVSSVLGWEMLEVLERWSKKSERGFGSR